MNPIEFALRRPITIMVAMVALVAGGWLALSRMKVDIFPSLDLPVVYVAQPYGGMDPTPDGRADRQLLRISLPLHQRHPSRRIEERPGHVADEAVFPSRHRHGPGDGRDGRLRQPRRGPSCRRAPSRRSSCASTPAACRSAISCFPARPKRSAKSRTRPCSRCGPCSPPFPAFRPRRRSAATSAPLSSASIPNRLRSYNLSPDDVVRCLVGRQHDQPVRQHPHHHDHAAGAEQRDGGQAGRTGQHRRSSRACSCATWFAAIPLPKSR